MQVSPRHVLLVARHPGGLGAGALEIVLGGHPLQPPYARLLLPQEGAGWHLLLAGPQPALAIAQELTLRDAEGGRATLPLRQCRSLAEMLGPSQTPGLLLRILHFCAARGQGALRAGRDPELASFLRDSHAMAETPGDRLAPLALCGLDLAAWQLPGAATATGAMLVTAEGILRLAAADRRLLVLPRSLEGALLLLPDAASPLVLGPATNATPTLAGLAESRHQGARGLHAAIIGEMAQLSAQDPAMRSALWAAETQRRALPPTSHAEPAHPVSATLDMAISDHGGGLFLRGWIRDPLNLVHGLTLVSHHARHRLDPARLHRMARGGLAQHFAEAPHGGIGDRAGFVAWLPEGDSIPALQWSLRLQLATGDRLEVLAPTGLLPPAAARDQLASAVTLDQLSEAMVDECLLPAAQRTQQAVMAQRARPEVVQIGQRPARPDLALVIPLYRNLRFLRHQVAQFSRDPDLAQAELVFVLDSPEQRADVVQHLRGLHLLCGQPITLVVQAANYGYASACNAGAAEARAPVLAMLNSDVLPAARGWVRPLLARLGQPGVAAVGPKLLFHDGGVQHAGLFFERYGAWDEWYNNHYWKGFPRAFPPLNRPRPVPGVTGAALFLRRETFESVGGFTTDYIIGDYEDSDLCLKLRAAGGEVWYEPAAELFHFERQSIRENAVHDRNLATALNRRLHQQRWGKQMAALMARPEFMPAVPPAGHG